MWLILAGIKSVEINLSIYMSVLRTGHVGVCTFNGALLPPFSFAAVLYFLALLLTGLKA